MVSSKQHLLSHCQPFPCPEQAMLLQPRQAHEREARAIFPKASTASRHTSSSSFINNCTNNSPPCAARMLSSYPASAIIPKNCSACTGRFSSPSRKARTTNATPFARSTTGATVSGNSAKQRHNTRVADSSKVLSAAVAARTDSRHARTAWMPWVCVMRSTSSLVERAGCKMLRS